MLESLNKLRGIGKWAVPVAVYGLRSAEATIQELSGLLRNRGFKILAGANFVAEHSFSHDKAPIAKGRPHEGDLAIAADFGKKITEKMNKGLEEAPIESKPLKAGENYTRKREDWPENATGKMVNVPSFPSEKCNQCQICVESCPTGAINADTYVIEGYECRRCFACVKVCPTEAWNINLPAPVIEFFTALDTNKTPEIFI
jgi:ferredoxin